jgi:predicted AAA+ superfamily ATPase
MVDEDSRPGRFVLTGSHNLLLMNSVSQTLAGRSAIHHLLPLALHELLDRSAPNPECLDELGPPLPAPPGLRLWDVVWRGLYPRIHDLDLDPTRWLGDYFRTYVERDLREVLRVMDLDAFERFVRLVAARTGQELNYASLASDAGITQPTVKQWLTALRVGFIVTLLPSHHANFRKRIRKRSKLHFLDTGLACYLLGIRNPETLSQHPLRGPLFESFVASELTKCFVHRGLEAPLFHWRDATGHEIDILIDLGSRQIPIEVKAGKTVASDALDTLRWWSNLPSNPNTGGVLVYGGEEGRMRSGVAIRPWYLE